MTTDPAPPPPTGADNRFPNSAQDALLERAWIVHATHSPATEAQIATVVSFYLKRHAALIAYLRKPKSVPGNQIRSTNWRKADSVFFGAATVLAAAFGVMYPNIDPRRVLPHTLELIKVRTGELCTGWTETADGPTHHHKDDTCPVHVQEDDI
jgi:hypothetical protein